MQEILLGLSGQAINPDDSDNKKKNSEEEEEEKEMELVVAQPCVVVGRMRSPVESKRMTPTAMATATIVEKVLLKGDLYMGTLLENAPHKTSKYLWSDDCMYKWEWKKCKASDKGKFSWPSRATYERNSSSVEWRVTTPSLASIWTPTKAHGSQIASTTLVRSATLMEMYMKAHENSICSMVNGGMSGAMGMSMRVSGRTRLFPVKGF